MAGPAASSRSAASEQGLPAAAPAAAHAQVPLVNVSPPAVLEVQHALRDVISTSARGVLRDRRAQRLRQEHAPQDPGRHLHADRGESRSRSPVAVHRARGRFNPELTGRENVYLNGAMMGFSPKRGRRALRRDHRLRGARGLHRPEAQELLLGHAGPYRLLCHEARGDVLLIDEVLAVGDAAFQRKCFEYFRALKEGRHGRLRHPRHGSVREFCDRAILIEDSRILHRGERRRHRRAIHEALRPDPVDSPFRARG